MAKKKTASKPKKQAINKKSVQQQIWRLQNKLDTPKLSLEDKRALENKLSKEKKKIGYEGPTNRESDRLSKEKRSITSKKSKLKKKFLDPKTTQKERNKIRKELFNLGSREREVKKGLGEKQTRHRKLKSIEKHKEGKGIFIQVLPPWAVRQNVLEPSLKANEISIYIFIGFGSSKKSNKAEIKSLWYRMDQDAASRKKYNIEIVTDSNNKSITFSIVD